MFQLLIVIVGLVAGGFGLEHYRLAYAQHQVTTLKQELQVADESVRQWKSAAEQCSKNSQKLARDVQTAKSIVKAANDKAAIFAKKANQKAEAIALKFDAAKSCSDSVSDFVRGLQK